MILHFYGTGASEGVPAPFCECPTCVAARRNGGKDRRARACCLIDGRLMIDFPPDTFAQALYGGLDLCRVDAILFTHAHPDHFYPQELVNLGPPMAMRARTDDIGVYGPPEVVAAVDKVVAGEKRGRVPVRTETLADGIAATVAGYRVLPVRTVHAPSMTCFAYVIERDGRTLLYLCDSGLPPEAMWPALPGRRYDAVVMDCTFADAEHAPGGHMGLDENRAVMRRLTAAGCADGRTAFIATHFCHTAAPLMDRIGPILAACGIIPAYDGMEIEI